MAFSLISATSSYAQVPELPEDTLPKKLDLESIPIGFDHRPADPENNPISAARVQLGRKLFFDPILSTDGTVACASCHRPDHGFASPEPIAVGIKGKKGTRNAPSIINAAYAKSLSWDGRDASLEAQVLGPLTNELELGGNVDLVIANIKKNKAYAAEFASVFNAPSDKSVTAENLAKAIASFERTIVRGDNGVDKFRRQEYKALSKSARTGMWIFESRGGCWQCHSGHNMSDDKFHNTGVSHGTDARDVGRMEFTEDSAHEFQFRTPSLRNVELTAPYMHDGSIGTLREVVEFYNRGGSPDDKRLDKKMKPLGLTDEEVGFVVEFLKALTSENLDFDAGANADE